MASVKDFIALGLKQVGKPYVFGTETRLSDPDPSAFDCSELVQWIGARLGLEIPDGAINQYSWIEKAGSAVPVSRALGIPGALLFKHGVGRHAPIYHVGISLGNGKILEAKGSNYGVVVDAPGTWADGPAQKENCWNLAGLIPGLDYSSSGGGSGLLVGLVLMGLAWWL